MQAVSDKAKREDKITTEAGPRAPHLSKKSQSGRSKHSQIIKKQVASPVLVALTDEDLLIYRPTVV